MTANVRCAGIPARMFWTGSGWRLEYDPCGWEGERDSKGDPFRLTMPCPNCRGRVELIEEH